MFPEVGNSTTRSSVVQGEHGSAGTPNAMTSFEAQWEEAPEVADVKMYTTTWCGICVHTKRYLKSKNVEFEEIDIEEHPEHGDRIEEITGGYRIVPTLEIGGKLMVNPSCREIDEALAGATA